MLYHLIYPQAIRPTDELRNRYADPRPRARTSKSDAERGQWGAGQGYIALGYLLLAASSLGYATSPMLGFDPAEVKEAFGLPGHVMIPAIVIPAIVQRNVDFYAGVLGITATLPSIAMPGERVVPFE